jgi:hypothetical protein
MPKDLVTKRGSVPPMTGKPRVPLKYECALVIPIGGSNERSLELAADLGNGTLIDARDTTHNWNLV